MWKILSKMPIYLNFNSSTEFRGEMEKKNEITHAALLELDFNWGLCKLLNTIGQNHYQNQDPHLIPSNNTQKVLF